MGKSATELNIFFQSKKQFSDNSIVLQPCKSLLFAYQRQLGFSCFCIPPVIGHYFHRSKWRISGLTKNVFGKGRSNLITFSNNGGYSLYYTAVGSLHMTCASQVHADKTAMSKCTDLKIISPEVTSYQKNSVF